MALFGRNSDLLNDDTILWFIILFLLIFCNHDRVGGVSNECC